VYGLGRRGWVGMVAAGVGMTRVRMTIRRLGVVRELPKHGCDMHGTTGIRSSWS